jgi:dihydropteroate synthase
MRALSLPNGRNLDVSGKPLVMGILNATPDSFYAGSRTIDPRAAVDRGLSMVEEGAAILDIGGESSRPGSEYVDEATELSRVLPVVEAIRRQSSVAISVDTRKSAVARAALDAGADIINDISALRDDPALMELCAERDVPVILMHMRGTPKTMQKEPHYDDPVVEIRGELAEFVANAEAGGVRQIIVDPGIGFGKRLSDNLAILANLDALRGIGRPILVGLSRKSFLGMILRSPDGTIRSTDDRLAATLAAHAVSALRGASILRVHDVRETADLLEVISAIEERRISKEGAWIG